MASQLVTRTFAAFCASTRQRAVLAHRMSTAPSTSNDIRSQLMTELKAAMKIKDTFKSTTIRSVLAEVQTADKARPEPLSTSGIVSIIRKAATRRTETAAEFEKAARQDLAEKEKREAELLQIFLPPLLSQVEIDRVLHEIVEEQKPRPGDNMKKVQGMVMKAFYSKVDRSTVDAELVKSRAEAALAVPQPTS